MGDTDKMCVYEGYNKARDCRVETLVKHEVHRYLSTSEWINAAVKNKLKLLSIDYPILDDGISNWVRFGQFLKEEFLKGKIKG